MIKIPASQTINLLVETLLPRFSPEEKALHIEIEANLRHPVSHKEKRKWIHFIFTRPNNYTKVFSFVSSRPVSKYQIDLTEFEFKCDHDSCWRNAVESVLSEVYFDLTKDKEIAPVKFEDSSDLSIFCPNFFMVKVVPDTTDARGYKKKIESGEIWTQKELTTKQ